jgi:hypothetical protein
MAWILPLFSAQPRLAPIYNPITHMVPPPFPMLLIVPALGVDLILWKKERIIRWYRFDLAFQVGAVFMALLIAVQWFFSEFLLSSGADNWFFAGGNRAWDYGSRLGDWTHEFWHFFKGHPTDPLFTPGNLGMCWLLAGFTCWLGLLLGGWMRKVQR